MVVWPQIMPPDDCVTAQAAAQAPTPPEPSGKIVHATPDNLLPAILGWMVVNINMFVSEPCGVDGRGPLPKVLPTQEIA